MVSYAGSYACVVLPGCQCRGYPIYYYCMRMHSHLLVLLTGVVMQCLHVASSQQDGHCVQWHASRVGNWVGSDQHQNAASSIALQYACCCCPIMCSRVVVAAFKLAYSQDAGMVPKMGSSPISIDTNGLTTVIAGCMSRQFTN